MTAVVRRRGVGAVVAMELIQLFARMRRHMLKRNILRVAFLGTSILFAVDFSSCGPTGELMELLLPTVIFGLAT